MKIGDWILTLENSVYSWSHRNKENIWVLPIRLFIYIVGFIVFQISNLVAQIRWPFSAFVRFVRSFFPIYDGEPIPASDKNLQKLIDENQVVIVDFWTEWCGPCILMEGSLKELAKQYKGKITVAKVDATINPKLTKKYNVMGYPTIMLFFEGKEIGRKTGALNYKSLVRFLDYYLTEK